MDRTVTQQDEMGCGAACVAFIVKLPYDVVANDLGSRKAKTAGFQLKELAAALKLYGQEYKTSHSNRAPKKALYAEGSIVFISRSKRYPYGHYLVRHKNQWMDPWINLPRNKNIADAQSGFRQRLPGKAQWVVYRVYTRSAPV